MLNVSIICLEFCCLRYFMAAFVFLTFLGSFDLPILCCKMVLARLRISMSSSSRFSSSSFRFSHCLLKLQRIFCSVAVAAVVFSVHHNTGNEFSDLPLAVVTCCVVFQSLLDRLPKQCFHILCSPAHLRIERLTIHHDSVLVVEVHA